MGCDRDPDPTRRLPGLLAAVLLLSSSLAVRADAAGSDLGAQPPGQFDYYVLSLSWVPGFCATQRGQAAECASGLGFALHGLWPQLNGGAYPTDCTAVPLSQGDIQNYRDLYASRSLITHEWRKHGTCSGLQPSAYFTLASRDLRRIRIPLADSPAADLTAADATAVKSAFVAANPGLPLQGITAVAERGVLTEIDICVTKAGAFRPC
jgi:ribonuclease T2